MTPNSMNGPVFVASVIERKGWSSNNSMVGHENVVEVAVRRLVRVHLWLYSPLTILDRPQLFNPLIFLRDPKGPASGSNLCTLLAIAARNSISIWFTSVSHPFVILDEVFDRDILDMSWFVVNLHAIDIPRVELTSCLVSCRKIGRPMVSLFGLARPMDMWPSSTLTHPSSTPSLPPGRRRPTTRHTDSNEGRILLIPPPSSPTLPLRLPLER